MTNTQRWIAVLLLWCVWFSVVTTMQHRYRAALRADFAHTEYLMTNSLPR